MGYAAETTTGIGAAAGESAAFYYEECLCDRRLRKASCDDALIMSSSRWCQSISISMKNECLYGSVRGVGMQKDFELLVTWLSKMLVVT